jgi:hypothetical protein
MPCKSLCQRAGGVGGGVLKEAVIVIKHIIISINCCTCANTAAWWNDMFYNRMLAYLLMLYDSLSRSEVRVNSKNVFFHQRRITSYKLDMLYQKREMPRSAKSDKKIRHWFLYKFCRHDLSIESRFRYRVSSTKYQHQLLQMHRHLLLILQFSLFLIIMYKNMSTKKQASSFSISRSWIFPFLKPNPWIMWILSPRPRPNHVWMKKAH